MERTQGGTPRTVRSLFVSDLHLGCKHAQAAGFLSFLKTVDPRHLYLVGDFIDGWRLRRRWWWEPVYLEIFHLLTDMARHGVRIYYTPGNHDDFLRQPGLITLLSCGGLLRIRDEFIHDTADSRRFLVTHGDRFDGVERRAKWLSVLGSGAYNLLLASDRLVHRIRRRTGACHYPLSAAVKSRVKRAVSHIGGFEISLTGHARDMRCHGVICGHIHTPRIAVHQGLTYCNTGDWVEHCTALVEDGEGRMRLLVRRGDGEMRLLAIEGHVHVAEEEAESLAPTAR